MYMINRKLKTQFNTIQNVALLVVQYLITITIKRRDYSHYLNCILFI